MLSVYIKSDGPKKSVKDESNLNSAKYIQCMSKNFIPDQYGGKDFQHDRAPGHISRVAQQNFPDECVTVLKQYSAIIKPMT